MRETLKYWLVCVGHVVLGAFVGSFVLENVTRLAIWQLVARVYDVQFALLITITSLVGGLLGGAAAVAQLLIQARRFTLAGSLMLLSGGLGVVLSLPLLLQAQQVFAGNHHPLIDALAYTGCTCVVSVVVLCWGLRILVKRGGTAS